MAFAAALAVLAGPGPSQAKKPDDVSLRITGLMDFSFPSWFGETVAAADSVCIFASGRTNYQITASGSGPGGAFELQQMNGNGTMVFEAEWNDVDLDHGFKNLNPGKPRRNQRNVERASETCNGGANARLRIIIPDDRQNQKAPPGAYRGTLTLVVAPD